MNQELDKILAEIGREHRATAAPESVEAVLRAAADARHEDTWRRKQAWAWAVSLVLLAAIAVIGVDVHFRKGVRPHDRPINAQSTAPQPEKERHAEKNTQADVSLLPKPEATHPARTSASRKPSTSNPQAQAGAQKSVAGNSLQEFIPLPASEGLPPATQLSVVRVKLQGSDLQQYGLEAPANALARSLMAEFVVGEDGLPRAIRILQ
jgi:hypothetical protein